jgi:hypothetical protein
MKSGIACSRARCGASLRDDTTLACDVWRIVLAAINFAVDTRPAIKESAQCARVAKKQRISSVVLR